MSGTRPFYCPVELRFCVRPHSDIGVRFEPIFAQWKYINEYSYSSRLIHLILDELNNYKLDENDLKAIFEKYKKVAKYVDSYNKGFTDKLVYNLFSDKSRHLILKSNHEKLYNELFIKSYKDKDLFINLELINFLAINKNIDLLLEILKIDTTDKRLKREIFHAIIISQKYNSDYVDYSNIIVDLIKSEEDIEVKSSFVKDSLSMDNHEIIEFVIKYINENERYYLKELNEDNYFTSTYSHYFLFPLLSSSNSFWGDRQKHIKEIKFNLFTKLLSKISNKENKFEMMKSITQFISKDDIYLVKKLRNIVLNEKDILLKERMVNMINIMNIKNVK